ncbi:hypothetical protein [Kitasatospora sp. NBC_01302]|uniref:hypothetical protein n=1 Tax=Kitasatospora sp. NBC_01302 TaxID=2903575 RepID=UPI002E0FB3CA|nr:hypothetical protein OG294_15820 [Kitasatospora sp. NBC_01302]
MRSGLVQTGAWAVATTAGVVLSWLGVNAVLSDSAFEAPSALPLPVAAPDQPAGLTAAAPAPSAPPTGATPLSAAPTDPPAASRSRAAPAEPATPAPRPTAGAPAPTPPTTAAPVTAPAPVTRPAPSGAADPRSTTSSSGTTNPSGSGATTPGSSDDDSPGGTPDDDAQDPLSAALGTQGSAGTVGATTGTVHSYLVPGGRVALDLGPDSAELVSAVPDPGWQMQLWNGDEWLRIDFSRGNAANSVFVTWNGHAPDVQTVVR